MCSLYFQLVYFPKISVFVNRLLLIIQNHICLKADTKII